MYLSGIGGMVIINAMSIRKLILIVGHLVTYPTVYLPAKYILLPCFRLFEGYKKSVIGTCVILAPPNQTDQILKGIEYLRTLDSEMYRRLTAERRFLFFYKKGSYNRMLDIFSIPDNFLAWGREGVVTCLVQAVIGSAMEQSPLKESKLTRHQVLQQIYEWLKNHSFQPELIKQYEKFAESS